MEANYLDDPYYAINVNVIERPVGKFKAVGRIKRRDTQESVAGAISFESNGDNARADCLKRLATDIARLPRPPYEWGLIDRRLTVLAYVDFHEGLTRISLEMQKERAAGTLSEELLHEKLGGLVAYVSKHVLSLRNRIDALDERDRYALTIDAPKDKKNRPGELSEDEIAARQGLRELFLNGGPRGQ